MNKLNNKNEIITIKNVRGYIDEKGNAWLNLEDVAKGLGIIKREVKNGKKYERINKQALKGWLIEFGIINSEDDLPEYIQENIFYKLCMKADNEVARKFQDRVCDEILPSIRKYGMYATDELLDNPDLIIKMATRLKEEKAKNKELEDKMKENKPKVLFADAVATSQSSILVGDLAKILKQNGIETGQKRLFSKLRDEGYLIKQNGMSYNMPTQKSMELELFEIKETAVTHSDGHISINKTVKVTGKGQQYFINLFLNEKIA